ncbi:hypothetical protein [Paremcibacter congregatus]|uniref:hypothetical protein n=1 Tax=Paremcibacter congregatus TaxID=2043170 RepID=UPI0030ECCB6A
MIILASFSPYDPVAGEEVTVRMSSGAGVPVFNNQHWRSRIKNNFTLGMTVFEAGFETAGSTRTSGSLQIEIGDGDLDALTAYNWDQRKVEVWTGESDDFADFTLRFQGVVARHRFSEKTLEIQLGDKSNIFDQPLDIPVYAGTGDTEGPAEFVGVVKPFCFGPVFNMEPTLVDSVNQIYQVHFRSTEAITGVFDRGVALTDAGDTADLSAWIAVPGQFKTDLSKGLFKLGAQPSGLITTDVEGDNVGGYVTRAGDIIWRLLDFIPPAAAMAINGASFTAVNAANPASCSIHARQALNAREVFDVCMRSIGGFWFVDWQGLLTVGIHGFSAPVATLTTRHIGSLTRLESPAPIWRLKTTYRPTYRVQSGDEIAASQLGGAFRSGSGAPSGGLGIEDDVYLDTDNGYVYKKTGPALWEFQYDITGDPGAAGTDGDQWFNGSGAPDGALGLIGDHYLDGDTGNYYQKTGAAIWSLQGNIAGPQGDPGAAGLSIAELLIFKRSASSPATPTGGEYDFGTKVLTPPAGWTWGVPAGTDPVYVATAAASIQGTIGTDNTLSWSSPVKTFQDGENGTPGGDGLDGIDGTDGADGSSVDIVFQRAASQPATPAVSSGTPGGWYTDVNSVPATADPIWSSVGTRPSAASNWTWQTPVKLEGQDGASGFTLFSNAADSILVTPTSIKKIGGESWNEGGYSLQKYTAAYVTFRAAETNKHFMIGLTDASNWDTDNGYGLIDFAWYCLGDGTTNIYESGNARGSMGPYTSSTIFSIINDGAQVRYYMDGVLKYTSSITPPAVPMALDSSLYQNNAEILDIGFGPSGTAGQQGNPGTDGSNGSDGSDGADGRTYITYRQAAAPASPAEGDTWFETDTGVLWGRISNAWFYIGTYNSGALANLNTIATNNIDNEAVTRRWASSSTANVSIPTSWVTLRSLTVSAVGTGGLVVEASALTILDLNDEFGSIVLRLRRGASTYLFGGSGGTTIQEGNSGNTPLKLRDTTTLPIVDSLSAGTYTYYLEAKGVNAGTKTSPFSSLVVVESKK